MANTSSRNSEPNRGLGQQQSWAKKFSAAWRGVRIAVGSEKSFFVHLSVTVIVLLAAALLGISRLEWCLIVLCIAVALSAELFNTSIERIAKSVTKTEDEYIRDALDIAGGAVLVIAFGAIVLGVLILGVHTIEMISS